jgi:hypothetical protein
MTAPPLPESALTRFVPSNEAMKPGPGGRPVLPSVEDAYRMGRDYTSNGPNEENCHFRLFAPPDHTRAWERGKGRCYYREVTP